MDRSGNLNTNDSATAWDLDPHNRLVFRTYKHTSRVYMSLLHPLPKHARKPRKPSVFAFSRKRGASQHIRSQSWCIEDVAMPGLGAS